MQAYGLRRGFASVKFILEVVALSKDISWCPFEASGDRQATAGEAFLCDSCLRLVGGFPTSKGIYLPPLI